jgi:hypothetical protein
MLLASYIRPFDAKQKVYVLDNKKNTEEIRLADLDTYSDTVMQLIAEYAVDEVELHGNEDICDKIKKDILNAEFTKYNNNQLKITLKGAK